jgi:hypothetical protein
MAFTKKFDYLKEAETLSNFIRNFKDEKGEPKYIDMLVRTNYLTF